MGPEWGTNCTIGVPTVDACVNASLVEESGRMEGNLDAGASFLPLPLPLLSRLSFACTQTGLRHVLRRAEGARQIQPLTRVQRVTAYCTTPPIKADVDPYPFQASTGEAIMQRCIYRDNFGCAHAATRSPPPPRRRPPQCVLAW